MMFGAERAATCFPMISEVVFNNSIEIFGLCGAGKSTILLNLVRVMEEELGEISPALEEPVEPGGCVTLIEASRIICRSLKRAPKALPKFLLSRENWWLPLKLGYRTAGIKIRDGKQFSLLVDSGVLQPFVSFMVEKNIKLRQAPLDILFKAISLPSGIIYVRTSARTALRRYLRREFTAGRKVILRNIKGRFDIGFRTCEWIHQAYRLMDLPVAVIDMEQAIDDDRLKYFVAPIIREMKVG